MRLDMNRNALPERKQVILFNLGSVLDYLGVGFLISHAVHLLILKVSADLPETLFALAVGLGLTMMLPYKWSKRWLRIQSFALISSYILVFGIFVYTRTAPGFQSLGAAVS